MIYTVTLNPAIDYVVRLNSALTAGVINRSTEEVVQFGGKGINVSTVLKTLNMESVALGFIAGFTGDGLENGLRAQGLNTRFLRVKQGMTRINVKVKSEVETEINGCGPQITQEDMQALYAQLDVLRTGDTLILSGSIPSCLPADTYERIMAHLQGRGVRFVVDATRDLLVNVLKYRPFLIKPNHHELEEIFGRTLHTEEEILDCARKLQEKGACNVLVSMAENGALLLDAFGVGHWIGCPQGVVVNSVGAGDSMVAGFVAGWMQTGDYDHALKLGTAAGSATAFSLGLADGSSIQALFESI